MINRSSGILLHISSLPNKYGIGTIMTIIPVQDLLELDSKGQINVPGKLSDNWEWKSLKKSQKNFFRKITKKYNPFSY